MKLNEILANLDAGQPMLSHVIREVDVDAADFADLLREDGFIFEVDLDQAVGYYHLPNDAGDIDPVVVQLNAQQVEAARKHIEENY